jgi:putative DNA primase/helicase
MDDAEVKGAGAQDGDEDGRRVHVDSAGRHNSRRSRPQIVLKPGHLAEAVAALAQAFADGGAPIYRRGESCVCVLNEHHGGDSARGTMEPERDRLLLRTLSIPLVRTFASTYADIRMRRSGSDNTSSVDLPKGVAEAFIQLAPASMCLPELVGISPVPLMRPNGALVHEAGYDPISRRYLAFEAGLALDVPAKPSREDAARALDVLKEPLRDFPFTDDIGVSVALSAMFSATFRLDLSTVPLHALSAASPGTGKTLLAEIVSLIATGAQPSVLAMGGTREEFEKRLESVVIAGDAMIVIDNVSRPMEGDTACIALTSSQMSVRVLGRSEILKLPVTSFFMATGNNFRARGDLVRRIVVAQMDAGVEHPEQRMFDRDLKAWVIENRSHLLSAIYTVRRAHLLAGEPDEELVPLGSFEAWSRCIRSALVWAGADDPVRSIDRLRDDDPEFEVRLAVLSAWHAHFGTERVKVAQLRPIIDRVENQGLGSELETTLVHALASIGRGPRADIKDVGYWLRSNRDRIAAGLQLLHLPDSKRGGAWWVEGP